MKKSSFMLVFFLILFCVSLAAENESCGKLRLGINFGYFSLNDSNNQIEPFNPDFLDGFFYGADAGFMITKNIELAASYTMISEENDILTITPPLPGKTKYNEWYLGGYYHLMGIYEPINIKIGAGIDFGTTNTQLLYYGVVVDEKDWDGIGFWFSAGIETIVSDLFNIGVEVIYLSLKPEGTDDPELEHIDIGGIRIKGFVKIIL